MKRLLLAFVGSVVLAPGLAGAVATTSWNFDPYWPTQPVCGCVYLTGFEVILLGNQTAFATGNYNSFPSGTDKVTYANGKTTIIFYSSAYSPTLSTADAIKANGTSPSQTFGSGHLAAPHFGFTGQVAGESAGGERLPPVTMEWLTGNPTSNPTVAGTVPNLGIKVKSNASTGPTKYLIEYVNAKVGSGTTGEWFEAPYQGSYQASFTNGSGASVTLSNARFFTSDTQIPLDNLNVNDTPPSGGNFQPIPGVPDGTMLPSSTPEPEAWALMLVGFAGLGGVLRRRRAVTARVRAGA